MYLKRLWIRFVGFYLLKWKFSILLYIRCNAYSNALKIFQVIACYDIRPLSGYFIQRIRFVSLSLLRPSSLKLIQSPPAGSAKFPVDVSKRTEAPGRRAGSFLEPLNFTSRLAIFFIFPIAVCIFSK